MKVLGHPSAHPHGDPTATAEGRIDHLAAWQLTAARPGEQISIRRVADAGPELLRYFSGLGLLPGTVLAVGQRKPFTAGTIFHTGAGQDITLTPQATDALWVVPAPA